MMKQQNIFETAVKGDTYIGEGEDLYTAGIHIELQGHIVECHGETAKGAEAIRDEVLRRLNANNETAELKECIRLARIFFNDVIPQIGGFTIQDYAALNQLGIALEKFKEEG